MSNIDYPFLSLLNKNSCTQIRPPNTKEDQCKAPDKQQRRLAKDQNLKPVDTVVVVTVGSTVVKAKFDEEHFPNLQIILGLIIFDGLLIFFMLLLINLLNLMIKKRT